MENAHFNLVDLTLAAVLVSSGIFAFRRGLVREIMALGTWILASIFAFSFYPIARPFFNDHIKNAMLADAATAIGLFCLAIVTLVPLGNYLNSLVKGPTLSSIDRSLGFVFGLIRGFVIMCLLYLAATFVWSTDPAMQPPWLAQARTRPMLAYGVDLLQSMVPEDAEGAASAELRRSREAAQEAADNARRLEDISTPVPATNYGRDSKPSSYGDDSRNRMNDIIDRKTVP